MKKSDKQASGNALPHLRRQTFCFCPAQYIQYTDQLNQKSTSCFIKKGSILTCKFILKTIEKTINRTCEKAEYTYKKKKELSQRSLWRWGLFLYYPPPEMCFIEFNQLKLDVRDQSKPYVWRILLFGGNALRISLRVL